MPINRNLVLSPPETILRAVGRLAAADTLEFGVQISGPEAELRSYLKEPPINLVAQPMGQESKYPPEKMPAYRPPDKTYFKEVETFPEDLLDPAVNLDIEFLITDSQLEPPFNLLFNVDPDIRQGFFHSYYLYGVSNLWVNCDTTVGDADLYLYEMIQGSWSLVEWSVASGAASDGVSRASAAPTNWRVRVFGYRNSTYTLNGSVNVF